MKKIVLLALLVCLFSSSLYASEMITIKDMAGRNVIIPKEVNKIVALHGSLRYIVYLNAFDKVVGVEDVEKHGIMKIMKGHSAVGRAYWNVIKDKVNNIPSIGEGGPAKLPDFEKLISIKPDLVIAFAVETADLIQRKTGIPVIVLHDAVLEGFRIEDIMNIFTLLGEILGKEHRAKELNQYIKQCIEDLTGRTKALQKRTVYIGAISARGAHGITSSEAQYQPLKWLNVKNVVDETKKIGHVFIDKEKLLVWNPDFLFIDTGGIVLVNEDYLKNKEFYKRLKAVKERRVYTVFPFNFYRTNLEILLSNAYFIGKIVYPERFKDIDPQKKAEEIFKKFLGRDIYIELKGVYEGYGKVEFEESGITIK